MPESVSGWRWRKCRVKAGTSERAENQGRSGDLIGQSAAVASRAQRESADAAKIWRPCPGCPKCIPNGGYVLRRGKWRCTTAHEYLFQFTKGGDYFGDGEAVSEVATTGNSGREIKVRGEFAGKNILPGKEPFRAIAESRNPRSVWTINTEPFKGQHFATYPSTLPKRCIEASTSKVGCCPVCGVCYAPIVEKERVATRPGVDTKCYENRGAANPDSPYLGHAEIGNRDPQRHVTRTIVIGYRPCCSCAAGNRLPPVPCVVFDPFLGSGQTARAAHWLGRDWLGCELNPVYAAMVPERVARPPKWAIKTVEKPSNSRKTAKPAKGQMNLFSLSE